MDPLVRERLDVLLREILYLERRISKADFPSELKDAITELERELGKVDLEAALKVAK